MVTTEACIKSPALDTGRTLYFGPKAPFFFRISSSSSFNC